MRLLFLPLILLAFTRTSSSADSSLPYLFVNFEDNKEFPSGTLRAGSHALQMMSPDASVVEGASQDESRHLMVSGAVALVGQRFTGDGQTHLELWAKPHSERTSDGTEFLDFDGAVVGLFESSEEKAEFHVFHATESDRGCWLSTGVTVALQKGVCEAWHRINVTQDWSQGTWSLGIDGAPVMEGIGRCTCAEGNLFELWLYGAGEREPSAFDDLVVSSVPPDVLERAVASRARAIARPPGNRQERRVARLSADAARRQHREPQPDSRKSASSRIFETHIEVVGGGRHIGEFTSKGKSGEDKKFALYTPGYDENGKPKPLQVRIRCDAKLELGASLRELEWAVTEMPKDKQSSVRVIVHGTFEKGPTLTVTIPSEWSNKALSIRTGYLKLERPSIGERR